MASSCSRIVSFTERGLNAGTTSQSSTLTITLPATLNKHAGTSSEEGKIPQSYQRQKTCISTSSMEGNIPQALPETNRHTGTSSVEEKIPQALPETNRHTGTSSVEEKIPQALPETNRHTGTSSVEEKIPQALPETNRHTGTSSVEAKIPQALPETNRHTGTSSVEDKIPQALPETNRHIGTSSVEEKIPQALPETNRHTGTSSVEAKIPQALPETNKRTGTSSVEEKIPQALPETNRHTGTSSVEEKIPQALPETNRHTGTSSVEAKIPQALPETNRHTGTSSVEEKIPQALPETNRHTGTSSVEAKILQALPETNKCTGTSSVEAKILKALPETNKRTGTSSVEEKIPQALPVTLNKHAGKADQHVIEKHISVLKGKQLYWLLLQGAVDRPKKPESKPYSKTNNNRNMDGDGKDEKYPFLKELVNDLKTVCDFLDKSKEGGVHLYSYSFQMKQTKAIAMKEIRDLFKECKTVGAFPVIYYTGHGKVGSGDWSFVKGKTISIREIIKLIPVEIPKLLIITDCCYSGHWADFCARSQEVKVEVIASAPYSSTCVDGKFISWLFPEESPPKVSVPPVFGVYNHFFIDHPHSVECEDLIHFLNGYLMGSSNKKRSIVSCSFAGNRFCAILANNMDEDKNQSKICERTSKQMTKMLDGKRIGKGTRMIARTSRGYFIYQHVHSSVIQNYFRVADPKNICKIINSPDLKIVSCCPGEKEEWLIVMDRIQQNKSYTVDELSTREKCMECISKNKVKGYILSKISYNKSTEKYLILMSHSPDEITTIEWFDEESDDESNDKSDGSIDDVVDGVTDEKSEEDQKSSFQKACSWMEKKMKENFCPYLIFKDPKTGKTLISLTNRELGLSDIDLILDAKIKCLQTKLKADTNGIESLDEIEDRSNCLLESIDDGE